MADISPIDRLEGIIRDIERTVANFSISGPGVSGHIKDGYIVNARSGVNQSGKGSGGGGPPPPPPETCPSSDITVEFSGITVDCGCIDGHPYGSSEFDTVVEIGAGINGAYIVPFNVDFAPPKYYEFDGVDNVIHYDIWSDPAIDCSGAPTTGSDASVEIQLICYPTTGFTIALRVGGLLLFYASNITDISGPVANEVSCGLIVDDPFLGHYLGVAHGGTVTITL